MHDVLHKSAHTSCLSLTNHYSDRTLSWLLGHISELACQPCEMMTGHVNTETVLKVW